MNRSIQTKMRRVSAHQQDGDAMPETLKIGDIKATRAAIDAYLDKRGLHYHTWKRKKG
jgi:hypothetical protein